jgi:hypothetical protein
MESRSFAGRWKQVLGGLVAAFLLLPVPAYAVINFSTLTWTEAGDVGNAISSVDSTGSNSTTGILNIFFAAGQTNAPAATITLTSNTLVAAGGESIDGAWSAGSLNNVYNVSGGTITVTVKLDTSGTNMFSSTLPTSATDLTADTVTASTKVVVTIAITAGTNYTTNSTASTLTLN